ncbi:MAG TPA: hypothetical protein ENI55_06355 [Alphaproteobacteria bacterium]|nr:hypothetical protein [Alphaproteobacteria bacterium]
MADALEAFKAPAEIVEKWRRRSKTEKRPEVFELPAKHETTLRLFLAMGTQWVFAGMDGVPTGISYAAVEPAARMLGLDATAELFDGLRIMENAALEVLLENRKNQTFSD